MLNIKNIFLIDFYSYFLNNNLFYSKKKNLGPKGLYPEGTGFLQSVLEGLFNFLTAFIKSQL